MDDFYRKANWTGIERQFGERVGTKRHPSDQRQGTDLYTRCHRAAAVKKTATKKSRHQKASEEELSLSVNGSKGCIASLQLSMAYVYMYRLSRTGSRAGAKSTVSLPLSLSDKYPRCMTNTLPVATNYRLKGSPAVPGTFPMLRSTLQQVESIN